MFIAKHLITVSWYAVDYLWSRQNMNESWVNGRKSLVTSDAKADNPDNTFEASANAAPNLLVVRNDTAKSFDIFGGQYLEKGGSHEVNANCCVPMYVHEVIFFDTALTDDQIREVTAILTKKWKVQVAVDIDLGTPACPFAADSDYVVTASTGLDLDGFWQTIKSLTFDVGGAESCPVLVVDGELDVTDTPLAFLNAANVGRGDFLTTTWGLTSPFLSVTGLEGVGKVSYRKSSARISTGGMVILVR